MWFSMLYGDSRDHWEGAGETDRRVQYFWDEQKVVGNWFSPNVLQRQWTTWDFYAVYAPDTRDLASPVSSAAPDHQPQDEVAVEY